MSAEDLSLTATSGLNINRDLAATGNLALTAGNTGVQQTAGDLMVGGTTSVNAGPRAGEPERPQQFQRRDQRYHARRKQRHHQFRRQPADAGHLSLGSGALTVLGNNITQTGAITQAAGAGAVTINGGASAST